MKTMQARFIQGKPHETMPTNKPLSYHRGKALAQKNALKRKRTTPSPPRELKSGHGNWANLSLSEVRTQMEQRKTPWPMMNPQILKTEPLARLISLTAQHVNLHRATRSPRRRLKGGMTLRVAIATQI